LFAAAEACLDAKRMRCSPRTLELEQERRVFLTRHFGDVPLTAITAQAIADYQQKRHDAGKANWTITTWTSGSCAACSSRAAHARPTSRRLRQAGKREDAGSSRRNPQTTCTFRCFSTSRDRNVTAHFTVCC
jgi:hypothetical protein